MLCFSKKLPINIKQKCQNFLFWFCENDNKIYNNLTNGFQWIGFDQPCFLHSLCVESKLKVKKLKDSNIQIFCIRNLGCRRFIHSFCGKLTFKLDQNSFLNLPKLPHFIHKIDVLFVCYVFVYMYIFDSRWRNLPFWRNICISKGNMILQSISTSVY